MTFAEKLKELREVKGWSQKDLADKSGQPQQSIANWERGIRAPLFGAVQSLCAALAVPCTVFDGCEYGVNESPRGRGRPKKPAPETTPAKDSSTPEKASKGGDGPAKKQQGKGKAKQE